MKERESTFSFAVSRIPGLCIHIYVFAIYSIERAFGDRELMTQRKEFCASVHVPLSNDLV